MSYGRVVIAKPGLDGHDRGAKIVALALRDAGLEVIYTGLHQSPAEIVSIAVQEDPDVVGLSILSGAHLPLTKDIVTRMRAAGLSDVAVVVGGSIPEADIPKLLALDVAAVFPVHSRLPDIVRMVVETCQRRRART